MKTKTSARTNSMNLSPVRLALLLIPFVLICFALSPQAWAVCREGCDTVFSSTFLGEDALINNTGGYFNTATGYQALLRNAWGTSNTATGHSALLNNIIGSANTATGYQALFYNGRGDFNTAIGDSALYVNTTGSYNTAAGARALVSNAEGGSNTAVGYNALFDATGSGNIAIGAFAGADLTTGDDNIDIGNIGVGNESNTIRVGTTGKQTRTFIAGISGATVPNGVGVIVGPTGKLGTVVSSIRFKDEIKPMDKASEAIFALKPVTFRYKHELDPGGIPQFGLVAEEVEKVNPDLVACDADGKAYTVRYEAVNAMLLNEFLKAHRKIEEQDRTNRQQEATITELKSAVAQQQDEIQTLKASLKEQAAQIQKVNDQLTLIESAPEMVLNSQ